MLVEKAPQNLSREEVIQIESGKPFLPFENITKFLREQLTLNDFTYVLRVHVNFKGIDGVVIAKAEGMEPLPNTRTPLGGVSILTQIDNEEETLIKAPVSLDLHFRVGEQQQIDELNAHKAVFNFGSEIYETEIIDPREVEDLESIAARSRDGLTDSGEFSKDGREYQVLLPFDLSKLSGIEVTFVKK